MARTSAAEKASATPTEQQPFSTGENFADLLEKSFSKRGIKEGSLIKGTVVALDGDEVIVDVGLKSEGRVSLKEFGGRPELKTGDEVEVYLERYEGRNGDIVLSREKALREEAWAKLEDAHTKNTPIEGVIFGQVKGGFTVDLNHIVAFLPGSQVDVKPIKEVGSMIGLRQPFLILKMDKKRGNIVVSRRAILEESRQEARDEILAGIKLGQVLEGTVKNLTNYGAFIDLGGIDGLLHVTDISWKRISHPSEVLSLGQTIKVQVIKFDDATKRVSLGMKQLESNPWEGIELRFPVKTKAKGKVTNIADYGVFVELEPGIEGLVHISELSWLKKNQNPNKIVSIGQDVEVMVLDIDIEKRRISLGIKQCEENPWQAFTETNKVGDIIEGEIKNVSDFGFFVGLSGGMDGLVHYSDLSWSESGEELLKSYKKGQSVKAKILAIDIEKERISLGVKQLEGADPFEKSTEQYKKGDVVTCTVKEIRDDGIEVSLVSADTPLTGFIKRADLSRDRAEQRPERFAIGDRVDAKVTSMNKKNRSVNLSIKALEAEEEKKAIEEYGSTDSGASLGDILSKALEKKSSEKSDKK